MLSFFRSLVEDFKAYRRGEYRVAPRGSTGRVYARKNSVTNVSEDPTPLAANGERTTVSGEGTNMNGRAQATLVMNIKRANGSEEVVRTSAQVLRDVKRGLI